MRSTFLYARAGFPARVLCCYICSGTVILNMVSTLKITCFTARRVLCCYICSGTVILNMVSTLKITCFTARHRAMRACRVAGSASRMRQLL